MHDALIRGSNMSKIWWSWLGTGFGFFLFIYIKIRFGGFGTEEMRAVFCANVEEGRECGPFDFFAYIFEMSLANLAVTLFSILLSFFACLILSAAIRVLYEDD